MVSGYSCLFDISWQIFRGLHFRYLPVCMLISKVSLSFLIANIRFFPSRILAYIHMKQTIIKRKTKKDISYQSLTPNGVALHHSFIYFNSLLSLMCLWSFCWRCFLGNQKIVADLAKLYFYNSSNSSWYEWLATTKSLRPHISNVRLFQNLHVLKAQKRVYDLVFVDFPYILRETEPSNTSSQSGRQAGRRANRQADEREIGSLVRNPFIYVSLLVPR